MTNGLGLPICITISAQDVDMTSWPMISWKTALRISTHAGLCFLQFTIITAGDHGSLEFNALE